MSGRVGSGSGDQQGAAGGWGGCARMIELVRRWLPPQRAGRRLCGTAFGVRRAVQQALLRLVTIGLDAPGGPRHDLCATRLGAVRLRTGSVSSVLDTWQVEELSSDCPLGRGSLQCVRGRLRS